MTTAKSATTKKGSLAEIINRRKALATEQSSARNKAQPVWEDDCGFQFQRVNHDSSPTIALSLVKNAADGPPDKNDVASNKDNKTPEPKASASTTSEAKTVVEKRRHRRKSLIASAASVTPTSDDLGKTTGTLAPRKSSINVPLTTSLPPTDVPPEDYYKHVHPDLPGPSKLRQLLVWSCQRALTPSPSHDKKTKMDKKTRMDKETELKPADRQIVQTFLDGLMAHKCPTSWYNRPIEEGGTVEKEGGQPSPQATDIDDTAFMLEQYRAKLLEEEEEWAALERDLDAQLASDPMDGQLELVLIDPEEQALLEQHHQITSWIRQEAPVQLDGLRWTLQMVDTFAQRAAGFCEDVFRQLFDQLDGRSPLSPSQVPAKKGPVEPLLMLRALSRSQSVSK